MTERLNFFAKQKKDLTEEFLTQMRKKGPAEKCVQTTAKAERLAPYTRWAILVDLKVELPGAPPPPIPIPKKRFFAMDETHPLG